MKKALLLLSFLSGLVMAQTPWSTTVQDSAGNTILIQGTVTVTTPPVVTPPVVTPPVVTPPVVTAPTTAVQKFAASDAALVNPERSWYGWSGAQTISGVNIGSLNGLYANGVTLGLVIVDMSAYRAKDLDATFMTMLDAKADLFRQAGVKMVVRPAYGYGSVPDATLAQVLRHIQQMSAFYAKNADVIGFIQAGYIGAWGEWHDSSNGLTSDANKATIKDALLASIPAQLTVSFRYPYDIVKWPANPRIGLHNDCIQSNTTDVGTYNNGLADANRQKMKALTANGPSGGETCDGFSPVRWACADTLSEFPAYHMAYLNAGYSPTFIQRMKTEGCYDTVNKMMGYRMQLTDLTYPKSAAKGSWPAFEVGVQNVGWAKIFSKRPIVITLRHKATGAELVGKSGLTLDTLGSQAGADTAIAVSVQVPSSAPSGDYDVLVSAPDIYSTTATRGEFAVQFANSGAWDGQRRLLSGAVLTVQ